MNNSAARSGVLTNMLGTYSDGIWAPDSDSRVFKVSNPANGDVLAEIFESSEAQRRASIECAARAQDEWAVTLPQFRAECLRRWHDLILENKSMLAGTITSEQGKPIGESIGEIEYAASFVEYYAEEAKRPDVIGATSHLEQAEIEVWREPCGVALLVTPWNFPAAMITRKAAAALAAGCAIIVVPSPETPLTAIRLFELLDRASFPAGVANLLVGNPERIVEPLLADPRVRVLSFTGSTHVGRQLYSQSGATIKRLVLELGGHAPFIAFEDVDVEYVVDQAIAAKFATSGQDCLAANRVMVHEQIYDRFCALLADRIERLTVDYGQCDPDIGPLINARAVEKQKNQVDDALNCGARLVLGGGKHSLGGNFFAPTLLVDVPHSAKIWSEETFGPVLAVSSFSSEEEVLNAANDTEYGLIAYLHTHDPDRIYRMSRGLSFGMVAVNRTKVTGPPIPFGGFKQSGIGREGGPHGMRAFTDLKYLCRNWSGRNG